MAEESSWEGVSEGQTRDGENGDRTLDPRDAQKGEHGAGRVGEYEGVWSVSADSSGGRVYKDSSCWIGDCREPTGAWEVKACRKSKRSQGQDRGDD